MGAIKKKFGEIKSVRTKNEARGAKQNSNGPITRERAHRGKEKVAY